MIYVCRSLGRRSDRLRVAALAWQVQQCKTRTCAQRHCCTTASSLPWISVKRCYGKKDQHMNFMCALGVCAATKTARLMAFQVYNLWYLTLLQVQTQAPVFVRWKSFHNARPERGCHPQLFSQLFPSPNTILPSLHVSVKHVWAVCKLHGVTS